MCVSRLHPAIGRSDLHCQQQQLWRLDAGVLQPFERRLRGLGITTYRQLAELSTADIQRINSALSAFENGRWAEARSDFRRAHELDPTARTLRTIGMCSFNLGDYIDAVQSLEAALEDFAGCAVVISHDRWFLNRLATHILAFEGDSHVEWFEGDFDSYEEDKKRRLGEDALIPHRIKYQKFGR
jgi:tetratricopeptide (TPR) repeat protein